MSALPAPTAAPALREQLRLGMMQLSPYGLSEQWLLRHLGDLHWSLIARAAGRPDTAFRDATGRPVYAAFCATRLQLSDRVARLGGTVGIAARLAQVSPHRLGSIHEVTGPEGLLARLEMISCFLSHDESGSNRRLLRSRLPGLPPLPVAQGPLMALHARARDTARRLRQGSPGPERLRLTPLPALDFNAVGLLYFPTFSRIAEQAAPSAGALRLREVIYAGNLDPGEEIVVSGPDETLVLHGPCGPLAEIRGRLRP
ncbi:hypothetical protein GR170_00645 [Pseudooceanicola sp. GBMRC 2024]|uniref:Uncharacterized protein n=1 Tax=Pseudooceanicola albus TaxID=2692189 RepID=A0A6L7FX37_9RHOB|nr:Pnap_2097 family protein [Pseudooceanicola albus]MXN16325.1 hypothetical protein [Pseudooceanicola albus]